MGAYEGGAHVLLLPRMPYGEGAARVPMRILRYLVNNQGGRPCEASATDAL